MPSEMVSSAYAEIGLKKGSFDSDVDSSRNKFNSAIDAMDQKARGFASSIGSALKAGAVAAGAAAVAGATVGLSAFKDLEDAAGSAASKSVDINGKSVEQIKQQFDSLRNHVMETSRALGATTIFDPTQVASAYDQIASAGHNVAEVGEKELLPFLDLAAGNMEFGLSRSTELVMSTMGQFGYSMQDSAKVCDILAKGSAASAMGLEDMQYALSYAGPVAKNANVSLEELLASMGALSTQGIKGEKAGTALRDAMNTLIGPTDTAAAALKSLGVDVGDVDPRTHNFTQTLAMLKQKADESGRGMEAFNDIFGITGGVLYSLAGMTPQVNELNTSLQNSAGFAHILAELKLDSLAMDFEAAKGAAMDLAIGLGQYLSPVARAVLQWFSAIQPKIAEFGDAIGKGNWSKVGTMLADGVKAGWTKTKELGGQLYNWIKGVSWSGLGSYIVAGVKGAWGEAQKLGGQLLAWLKGVKWSEVGTTILDAAKQGLNAVADFVKNWTLGGALLAGILGNDWSAFDRFKAAFNRMVEGLIDVGKWVLEKIQAVNWSDAAKSITEPISNGVKNLSNIGKQIWDYLNNVNWNGIGQTIGKGVNSAVDLVKDIGSKIANFISSHKWSEEGSNLATKIKGGIDTVKGWADSLVKGIKDTVKWSDIGKDIGNFLSDGLKAIKTYHDGLKSDFESWVSSGGAKNLGSRVGTAIANAIKELMDVAKWIVDSFREKGGGNAIKGAFETLVEWVSLGKTAADDFIEGFVVGLGTLGSYIQATIKNAVLEALASSFENLAPTDSPLGNWARDQYTGIAEYLRSQKSELPETFTTPAYSPSTGWTTPPGTTPAEHPTTSPTLEAGKTYEIGPDGKPYEVVGNKSTSAQVGLAASIGAKGEVTYKSGEKSRSVVHYKGKTLSPTEFVAVLGGEGKTAEEIRAVLEDIDANTSPNKKGSTWSYNESAVEEAISKFAKTAEETADIEIQSAKDAADIEKKEVKSMMDGVIKPPVKSMMDGVVQSAVKFQSYSEVAAGALKTGSEVGSKFLTNAGQAVAIGLDASGKEIAVIGRVAQEQFTAAGGKWLSDASQGGQQIASLSGQGANAIKLGGEQSKASQISGATAAATKTTTAAQTFQSKIDQGAATAMAAISKAGDPAQKLVIGAQYAANALVSAGHSLLSMANRKSNPYSILDNPWLPGYAAGTKTSGPQMAVIGEDGPTNPEYIIPTKKKRWDLLYQAMRAYGLRGFAEGTSTGSASLSGDADEMRAYFGISGLASMSKQVQKILNDLKDFFRITWAIIKGEGATYWRSINTVITTEVTSLRDNAWQAILDIRNTSIQANQQILSDATAQWAAVWPAMEPSIKSIHDNILSSFDDAKSNVGYIMDGLRNDAISQLQTFESDWTATWQKLIADLQQAQSQITSIIQGIAAQLSNISVNINLSAGGYGGYGGGGGDGGDWLSCGDINISGGSSCTVGGGSSVCGQSYIDAVIASTGPLATAGLGVTAGGGPSGASSSSYGWSGMNWSGSNPWAAQGALIEEPKRVIVGEKGPELILPTRLTKMFLSLADAGLGSGARASGGETEIVHEHHHYWNGRKVTDLVMTETRNKLQLRGATPTR